MDGDGVLILSLLLAELLVGAGIKKNIKIKCPLHPHPILFNVFQHEAFKYFTSRVPFSLRVHFYFLTLRKWIRIITLKNFV